MNWNKYPFFRLVLALAAGIGLAQGTGIWCLDLKWGLCLLIVLLLLGWLLHLRIKSYRYRWVFGLNMILAFVVVGCLRGGACDPASRDTYYNKVLGEARQGLFVARVCELPVVKDKTIRVQLDLRGLHSDTATLKVTGKVFAYLEKTEEASELAYGDVIAFKAFIGEVPPPKNPEEFDYRNHLKRLGVTGRVYLKAGDWTALGVNEGNPVFRFAGLFRNRLLDALRRSGVTEEEFGVAAAILLGYDESLSPQLRQQYVAAGSMHILCVSGMHVGIIYMLASFILGFVGKGEKMVRMRKTLLLGLIWCYAFLAGLSPSIMRSAMMITMVVVGELLHRKGIVLNSIAASAFLILLMNPNDLFSIGFQLSYAAVVGIVVLQRPVYLLFYLKNKILDKVWEITTVALSAQLATLPFTVYYFHQFTPYFWLSNLVMTPLSFLAILAGMLLLLVAWIPGVSLFMGKLVWACLRGMNLSVAWVESLPCSLVKGLYLNRLEFVLSLLLLLLFLLLVKFKKKRMLLELLTVAVVLSVSLAARSQRNAQQSRMVVYSLRNHTAVDLIQGTSHLLLCDDVLLADASAIDYSLKGAWAGMMLDMNPPCYILDEDVDSWIGAKRRHLLSFQGCLMAFWDHPMPDSVLPQPMEVEVLMVCGQQKPELKTALSWYRPALLLVDGSVPASYARQWKAQAETLHIECHCLADGCYIRDFKNRCKSIK